ncbi:MAG: hypothetical protein LCH67_03500 [Bacteroidetes bacterium]|nr:hypothetical protein [Bacteroidota bacterium]
MKLQNKIVVLLLLFISNFTFSQRVDIDKLRFSIKRTLYPKNPQGENVFFYNVVIKSNPGIRQFLTDEEIISEIKIDGLSQIDNQPNALTVNIIMDDFVIRKNELVSRTEETKDKDGKVTARKNYYKTKITYSIGASYDVRNSQNVEVIKRTNYFNPSNFKVFETNEFTSSSEANKYYLDNSVTIRSKLLRGEVNEMTNNLSNYFSYEVGYKKQTLNDFIWILDSKKHDEYENHQKFSRKLKEELEKFTEKTKGDDTDVVFGPIIDYYTKLSKLDIEDKHQKKLVYASLYNLSTLYYYLDDPIQAKIFAERLVKDDIDEKDGKELIKNADALLELFKKNNKYSTHFEREIPNPDMTLVPARTASTSNLSQTVAVEAPKAPRFIEGMVITNEDKEIEGFFFNDFENAPWEVQDGVRFIPATLFNDGKFDKKSVEKYSPKELKGLAIEKKLYIPVLFSDVSKLVNGSPLGATAKKYFMEVVKDGKYKILKYHEAPPSTQVFSGTMNPSTNTENLELLTLILAPGEEKAKKATTNYIEEILLKNKALYDLYLKGEYSIDKKPVNVKRDMLDRMAAKSDLSDNIDLIKIIEALNK